MVLIGMTDYLMGVKEIKHETPEKIDVTEVTEVEVKPKEFYNKNKEICLDMFSIAENETVKIKEYAPSLFREIR